MELAIRMREVGKDYGGETVLDRVDLDVERGAVVALLGPNGAGKTTLVNILATLVRADRGEASVAGFDVRTQAAEVRERIGLIGQAASVDPVLTGIENLRMIGRLSGLGARDARRRGAELVERFDLAGVAGKQVKTYSGGLRRRLDLALSLLVTPPVLFLDEPTTGLDTVSRQSLWEDVRALRAGGTSVLLTTQYLEEADRLADRVVVLARGGIVAEGAPAELKRRIGQEVLEVRTSAGIAASVPLDGTVEGYRRALESLAGIEGTVEVRMPTLDDVFVAVTGREEVAA
ncbi:ABC transporter ATP-binding protein [Naasia aerilata]|uniref:Daunorubicin resistance protein DrrA family ABC transporter ATP-binding protein n=1 Tax=Naasia aerilata TaxID=1162966 RepID=A0ABN6XKP2_9MICO|nr:ATP-binding cassette domain-containing protein [Naasia aerilata]BDZ44220.1 daunorubicin resistance protein DrrA family ABC transporter ATP-binding protein [Naasia aerilata]